MIETYDPKNTHKPTARCAECDNEVEHYNTFLSPLNEENVICWECMQSNDKGFNASKDFYRRSRIMGDIKPR
jgi:hypothetical protein